MKNIGGKAKSLEFLQKQGFKVPKFFIVESNLDLNTSEEEIRAKYNTLNSRSVSVRSSANIEDGDKQSFAGQFETFLFVNEDDLIEKIKACRRSLNSERIQFYCKVNKINPKKIKVHVIVQEMIYSDYAGVCFTQDPIDKDSPNMVIEIVKGQGEQLVSGSVTPESFTCNVNNIFEHDDIPSETLGTLINECQRIEDIHETPMDIEFAIKKDEVFFLQARPITTLDDDETYKPLYPQGIKIFRWGPIPGRWFYMGDFTESLFEFNKTFDFEEFVPCNLLIVNGELVWLIENERFFRYCTTLFKALINDPKLIQDLNTLWENAIENLQVFEKTIDNLEFKSFSEVLEKTSIYADLLHAFWNPTIPTEFAGYGAEKVLMKMMLQFIEDEREAGKALQVLSSPTELSIFQKADIKLCETKDLGEYSKKYHWLENNYGGIKKLGVSHFEKIKSRISENLEKEHMSRLEETKRRQRELIKKYSLPDQNASVFDLVKAIIIQQDKRKSYMMQSQERKEVILQKISSFLSLELDMLKNMSIREISRCKNVEEVRKIVESRKHGVMGLTQGEEVGKFSFYEKIKVEHYWRHYLIDKNVDIEKGLRGIVASRTTTIRVKGKVQVIQSLSEIDKFVPGRILVTRMTTPDYVRIMRKCLGIITDTGGLTSHAAILSRELGIPCIVGTENGTSILKTGDIIEMDTHGGNIKIVSDT